MTAARAGRVVDAGDRIEPGIIHPHLHCQRTLAHGRQHLSGSRAKPAGCSPSRLQPGNGDHDRVDLAGLRRGDPAVHVAADADDLKVGTGPAAGTPHVAGTRWRRVAPSGRVVQVGARWSP